MAACSVCVYSVAVWYRSKLAIAVNLCREKTNIRERNRIIVFVEAALHNVTPAFAELNRFSFRFSQSIKREEWFFFLRIYRRFVAFKSIFRIF